jgi:hypothetical protein
MKHVAPPRRRVRVSRNQSIQRRARCRILRGRTRRDPQEAEVILARPTDAEKRAAVRVVSEVSPVLQEGEVLTLID